MERGVRLWTIRCLLHEADKLVCDLMNARSYPMANLELRAADLSVDYPGVVKNYRAAHEIAQRHNRGEASTEVLRRAMIYYRDLFTELLENQRTHQEVHC